MDSPLLSLVLSCAVFLPLAAQQSPPGDARERVPVVVEHGGDTQLLSGLFTTMDVWHDAGAFVVGAAEPAQILGLERKGLTAVRLDATSDDELIVVDLARVDAARDIARAGRVLFRSGDLVLVAVPPDLETYPDPLRPAYVGHDGHLGISKTPIRRAPPTTAGAFTGVADARIQALVDQVDAARIEADVATLASLYSRNTTVPAYIDAARDLLIAQLQGYGLSPTTQNISATYGDNVLVDFPGTLSPNTYVVVGAHYDSRTSSSTASAPGADDNASGSAAVLELARILVNAPPFENSIRLIWFAGEEYGLHGSEAAAAAALAAGHDIVGMLNTDMNAYRAPNDTRDVDFVTNNTSPSLNAFCDAVGATYVAGWASTYGALGGGSSDHASYNAAGFPATFYFEDTGQYSPYIHTVNDAYPGGVPDFELSLMITRGVLAAAATLAEPVDLQIVHTPLPDTQDAAGPYPVVADVTSLIGTSVASVDLHYSGDGGQTYTTQPMTANGSTYTGSIPSFGSPVTIYYWLQALDDQGNLEVDPPGADAGEAPHAFFVGTRNVLYATDFEEAGDAGWTHDQVATQDDWQRGTPQGKAGDPSAAFSGAKVWGNDIGASNWNGAYQNNVHNWLRSPVIDCSAAGNVTLEFQRWLGVEAGQYDQAQILVNGVVVWENPFTGNLIDTAWVPFALDVTSHAAGNPAVQVELRLVSDGGVVFGGWNLDDFALVEQGPGTGTCPAPATYCTPKVNSLGCTPVLSTSGTPSVSDPGPFLLEASQVLNNQFGLVFYGYAPAAMPYQGGTLCLALPIQRGTILFSGGNASGSDCSGTYAYDFNARIQSGLDPSLVVGATVHAQFFSRDPASTGGLGLSGGMLFQVCP